MTFADNRQASMEQIVKNKNAFQVKWSLLTKTMWEVDVYNWSETSQCRSDTRPGGNESRLQSWQRWGRDILISGTWANDHRSGGDKKHANVHTSFIHDWTHVMFVTQGSPRGRHRKIFAQLLHSCLSFLPYLVNTSGILFTSQHGDKINISCDDYH